jgi:hypothetical protein
MSVEINQPRGVGYEDLFSDGYMSPMEMTAALDYYNNALVAQELGTPVGVVQRVHVLDGQLVAAARQPMSPTLRTQRANTFTTIARYLNEVSPDLYPEARYAFQKTKNPLAIAAVSEIAKTQAAEVFTAEPDAIGSLAHGMTVQQSSYDCNLRVVQGMASTGVLQHMRNYRDKNGALDTSILFYQLSYPSYERKEPKEIYEEYTQRRANFLELLGTPGLQEVLTSDVGKYLTYHLVEGIMVDRDHDIDAWRLKLDNVVELFSSPDAQPHLAAIAGSNPELLRYFLPDSRSTVAPLNMSQSIASLAEIASKCNGQELEAVTGVLMHTPWQESMHTAAVCIDVGIADLPPTARISIAGWLKNLRDGDLEVKRSLMKDPLFVKGLLESFRHEWVSRLQDAAGLYPTPQGQLTRLLVEKALPLTAPDILYRVDRRPEADWSFATEAYVAFFKKYRVSCIELLSVWDQTGGCPVEDPDYKQQRKIAEKHLKVMREIEAEAPGVCRALRDDFNIHNYGAATKEMWIDQYNARKQKDTPYAIVGLAQRDGNTALNQFADGHFARLHHDLRSNGRLLRIYEVNSARNAARAAISAKCRYGPRLAELAVIAAHSYGNAHLDGQAMFLSEGNEGMMSVSSLAELKNGAIVPRKEVTHALGGLMAEHGSVIVNSCSAASEQNSRLNIVNGLAAVTGRVALGTPQTTSLQTLSLDFSAGYTQVADLGFAFKRQHVTPVKYNGLSLREEAVRAGLLDQSSI